MTATIRCALLLLSLMVFACDNSDGRTTSDGGTDSDSLAPDVSPVLPDGPAADTAADAGQDVAPDSLMPDAAPGPDGPTSPDASPVGATVTDEKWYQGSQTCKPASIQLTGQPGKVLAQLRQVPAVDVQGTCIGHAASVALSGSTLQIDISGNTTSACWTACWDLEVEINGVPSGTYTVSYKSLNGSVTVP
jgi:hypothetical protein